MQEQVYGFLKCHHLQDLGQSPCLGEIVIRKINLSRWCSNLNAMLLWHWKAHHFTIQVWRAACLYTYAWMHRVLTRSNASGSSSAICLVAWSTSMSGTDNIQTPGCMLTMYQSLTYRNMPTLRPLPMLPVTLVVYGLISSCLKTAAWLGQR